MPNYMMNFGNLQYACLSYCIHDIVHVLAEFISEGLGGTSQNWLSSPLDLVISPPSLPVQGQALKCNIHMHVRVHVCVHVPSHVYMYVLAVHGW